jgi:N-ethylmaleimide reductase
MPRATPWRPGSTACRSWPITSIFWQFLNSATNRRTDEYGGSLPGRARLLFEVVEAVLENVDPELVGVKIGPMHESGPFAANKDTLPMAEYAIRELSEACPTC